MKDIPLGSIDSKIYENNGDIHYKISPIFGLKTSVWGDFNLSKVTVLVCNQKNLTFKSGVVKINMTFKPYTPGLEKVRVTKYVFGIIPLGCQFCEISVTNKNYLQAQFTNS
ncbi:hypothetical protein D0B88_05770 [Cellvibrio sp. KY-YJ-3]|nr:hypothetical protein D0B88_05770 [Cellvibrio sp. KY-YJ-3]